MAQSSNYPKRAKRLALISGLLTGAWYLIFQWNSFEYIQWNATPAYSPNCQYYITMHQTLWEKFTERPEFGTARLYDSSSNKLLYEGKTFLDAQAGPGWYDEMKRRGSVGFLGTRPGYEEWYFKLPTPPGDDRYRQKCPITQDR